jgi:hypothetical protein
VKPLRDLSFSQQPSFYLHRALCRSKLDIHLPVMLLFVLIETAFEHLISTANR